LLIPGDWFLHNDSVPFLTNLLLDICQKNKY
jgi:hypothetical protein